MTVVTRGIILSRDTDIAICQNRDLTRGNTKNLQKKLKKLKEKFKKKLKKRESDTCLPLTALIIFF